jgi:hypothetical protein
MSVFAILYMIVKRNVFSLAPSVFFKSQALWTEFYSMYAILNGYSMNRRFAF